MPDPRDANSFLVVVTNQWGKTKLDPIHHSYKDALEACAKHRETNPTAKYTIITGESDEIVMGKYATLMRGGQLTQYEAEDDLGRMLIEGGEGGDHDEEYHFQMPTEYPVLQTLIHLQALVTRGQLGGPNDGKEEDRDGRHSSDGDAWTGDVAA